MDSSLAYQGAGRSLSVDDVRRLSRWATSGLKPDLTVLLDIDPEVGLERARSSTQQQDRLERESLDFHRRVRAAFRSLADANPDHYLVVDAGGSPDTVATHIRLAAGKRLTARLAAQRTVPAEAAAGRPLRWRSRRSRTGSGATAAPVPPPGTAVPPVGVASAIPEPVPPPGTPVPPVGVAGAIPEPAEDTARDRSR